MTPEQLYILLMEQTLDNARINEARCRRRLDNAQVNLSDAQESVMRLRHQIEGFRQEMLKRGCV